MTAQLRWLNGAATPAPATIGAAAHASGVSAKMIRHYEQIGLIRPITRSAGNYRLYDEAALRALRFIGRARALGFSIREIERLLALWCDDKRQSAEVQAVALNHVAALDARIAALVSMRAALLDLAARCPGDARTACPILDELDGTICSRQVRP